MRRISGGHFHSLNGLVHQPGPVYVPRIVFLKSENFFSFFNRGRGKINAGHTHKYISPIVGGKLFKMETNPHHSFHNQ